MKIIKAIPTNIITGALGVGKTTVIKQLLKSKPANERWAVLVNEFGEIGIDGALLSAAFTKQMNQLADTQTVFLREVPGGCMCCASGLPMQIALNQLLAIAKPHRLLIEPTGLGHPKELIQILGSEYYKDVIKLDTTLCLIDARKVSDRRWRNHQTFQDQVEIADVIVATKCDLYADKDMPQLMHYIQGTSAEGTRVKSAVKGEIASDILSVLSQASNTVIKHASGIKKPFVADSGEEYQKPIVQPGSTKSIKATNNGDGFYSCGWIWPAHYWFDYADIIHAFSTMRVVRIKGLMITNQGIFSFNGTGLNGQTNEMDISEYDEALESRLELISDSEDAALQAAEAIEKILPIASE